MKKEIEIQGYRIKYIDQGQGPTLLFVHGWPTNHLLWKHQITHFQSNFRVIALDWVGFGESDKPADFPYSLHFPLDGISAHSGDPLERIPDHFL